MGTLAKKIEQSYLDVVGAEKNPKTAKFAEEMEAHIAEFITKQPLTIKKMKARGNIEKLTTTEEIPVDVPVDTLFSTHKPQIDLVKKLLKLVTELENIFKGLNKNLESFGVKIPIPPAIPELSKAGKKLEKAIKSVAKVVEKGGAIRSKMNLDKEGGDGGIMESRIYTYVGEESPSGESNIDESLVTLDKTKIELEY